MTMDTYGPRLGGEIIINAPRRSYDGKIGIVVSLHLATNEATVQIAGGTRHIVPWDSTEGRGIRGSRVEHGTRKRYMQGCVCDECMLAAAAYMRAYRARNGKAS